MKNVNKGFSKTTYAYYGAFLGVLNGASVGAVGGLKIATVLKGTPLVLVAVPVLCLGATLVAFGFYLGYHLGYDIGSVVENAKKNN
ncbi:MAG: hypothetical protein NTZ68_00625 [Candidatus Dependentiae bacterium]|nr:hypothetical protein [Candidatus Dependentiae bacterium]